MIDSFKEKFTVKIKKSVRKAMEEFRVDALGYRYSSEHSDKNIYVFLLKKNIG